MNILLDHKELRKFSSTKNNINVLGCSEVTEVQDNILLLKTRESSFLKEQVGTWLGKPVVKFNLLIENTLHKDVSFVVDINSETSLNFESLGIKKKPVITSILTENRVVNDITPEIITEHAKQVIFDTVKQGKKHLQNVLKEGSNQLSRSASKNFRDEVDKISGQAIAELEFLKEQISNHIFKEGEQLSLEKKEEINTLKKSVENISGSALAELELLKDEVETISGNALAELELLKNNVIKHVAAESEGVIAEKVKKVNTFIEENALTDLKRLKNDIIKNITETGDQLLSKTKQLAVKETEKIVESAKSHTTNAERMLNEYKNTTKRDVEDLRVKILRVAESGGGTNAVQYANGGTMIGDLHVTGQITGHTGLSSLNQDGAKIGDTIVWNGTEWISTTTKVVSSIGDNTSKEFFITHNFNTFDVFVQVYDNTTNALVYPAIIGNTLNDIKIEFSIIPNINNYRVVIKQ